MKETFDVIVIGSGVCGAIAAWKLAASKAKVLILEAGETSSDRVELVGKFAAAVRKTPGSPYKSTDADKYAPSPDLERDYYVQTSQDLFKSTYQRRAGGSTWHFLGNVPRFIPNDFKLHSIYGVGIDWPIKYENIEEAYCEAEELLGVSGDHKQWNNLFGAIRSREFPMTKIWETYSDQVVTRLINGLNIDGVDIKVMNTPQARNSQHYDDRPPCAGNSSCVPICPIQAKYDATVHVKKAIKAGAELYGKSVVTRLELDNEEKFVHKVIYKTWDNVEHAVQAKIVVLAAHAIESVKILLMSRNGTGIGNSSDCVGRHLMDHLQGYGVCLSREPLFPFRGPPVTSGIDTFRDGDFRKRHSAFRMSLGNDGWGRAGSPFEILSNLIEEDKLFGKALQQQFADHITRQFRISYSTEMLPDPDNRVTLSDKYDALGIPQPAITFKVDQYNKTAFEYAQKIIKGIFERMGAFNIKFPPPYSGAGHVMGTCRMGNDRRNSVVDSFCRSHDHPNLFVIGSSVFPTCGTANPTLTAVALTLRSVGEIEKSLRNDS